MVVEPVEKWITTGEHQCWQGGADQTNIWVKKKFTHSGRLWRTPDNLLETLHRFSTGFSTDPYFGIHMSCSPDMGVSKSNN
jgi:hypothetical protein